MSCDWPIDQEVLLHSEALRSGVALGFVLRPSWFGGGFAWLVLVALQLREFQHLILFDAAVVPSLLPHSRCVNHQSVLETYWITMLVHVFLLSVLFFHFFFLIYKETDFSCRWPQTHQQQYAKYLLFYSSEVAHFLYILPSTTSVISDYMFSRKTE